MFYFLGEYGHLETIHLLLVGRKLYLFRFIFSKLSLFNGPSLAESHLSKKLVKIHFQKKMLFKLEYFVFNQFCDLY